MEGLYFAITVFCHTSCNSTVSFFFNIYIYAYFFSYIQRLCNQKLKNMLKKNELADTFLNPSFVSTHCLLSYFQAPQIFGDGSNIISGIDIALPPKSQSSVKTGNFNQSCCIDNYTEQ